MQVDNDIIFLDIYIYDIKLFNLINFLIRI